MLVLIGRRIVMVVAVVWAAATLNFFIPRIAPKNPIAEKLTQLAGTSGVDPTKIQEMSQAFGARFGLDQPLLTQYLRYIGDMARFDFGQSITKYPARVSDLIGEALPWTLGLMITTTLLAFLIGTLLGAAAGWYRNSKLLSVVSPIIMVFSAIPFYLLGLVLIYIFASRLGWFPVSGGYGLTSVPEWSWDFAVEVLQHATLPALSILIASVGTWAIGMRGMMVTVQGEDYMTFAEAKGLKPSRLFYRYGMRNALLPQVTALALYFGQIVTGAVLVEIVFAYPGLGSLLLDSIKLFDFPTIYGIVFILTLTVALSMLLVDLLYPLLDPRARVGR
ncbi:ABC transporter permease [Bosea sp. (in: a-proteobacteria)]|jgi:peptide/nickel transport system permease protein|uniref:ABC transporter permease n=1 Tax=Bosea sp. (in: a-proteobacteria) TaxID=1871050 RepID=UPI001DA3A05E|nr:ABC transporter permease [Bosea sp. (in: a-proteobacteria)]MBA4221167.1 ABC transporter permease [Methylobacterium sp.]MBR3192619.1 ABC transporter permease [Bosea sp. (in: a-proteobacteria)]